MKHNETTPRAFVKMRRKATALGLSVTFALAVGLVSLGCSTDDICERACDAWAGCWSYEDCWDDCKAEGDWSSSYARCCEDHAGDCIDLESICG